MPHTINRFGRSLEPERRASGLVQTMGEEIVLVFEKPKPGSSLRLNANLRERLCPPTTIAGWAFSEEELREAICGDRLLCPSLDLSPVCNLDCPYCFQADEHHRSQSAGTLTLEKLKAIIVEMANAGARTINIIGAGEPLLDPRFEEVARFIHSFGVRLLVATNGIPLLSRANVRQTLMEIEASIVLKMNSMRPEIEDTMVGRPGYAAQRDRALGLLLESGFAECQPTRLAVNTVITVGNEAEILDIHRFCRERNICFIAGTYMPTGRTETPQHIATAPPSLGQPPRQNLAAITKAIRESDGVVAADVPQPPAYTSNLPCVQALGLYVDAGGLVWPCPTKKTLKDGKLASEHLEDIGDGQGLLQIWRHNAYMMSVRRDYSGGCPYKNLSHDITCGE